MLVALFSSEPSFPRASGHPAAQQHLSLGVRRPVHGIDLGQVPTQGPSGTHLNATDNLHTGHDLRKE